MTQKPQIQYIGMFYVHGSEAKKLAQEQRRAEARTKLPLERLRKIEVIHVDPVALIGIAVAVIMFVAMIWGALQITRDWVDYQKMSSYVSELNLENARLFRDYRNSIDLEEIRKEAVALGMVTTDRVPTRNITVSVPEPIPEATRMERFQEFLAGLFA